MIRSLRAAQREQAQGQGSEIAANSARFKGTSSICETAKAPDYLVTRIMNRTSWPLLFLAVWGSASAGLDSYLATDQIASWDLMQSAGGIRIGVPRKTDGGWVLPVACDVSGLSTITQKPTHMNSGLVVSRMLHQRNGREITISVAINAALSSSHTPHCPDVVLEAFPTGRYAVSYKESNGAIHPLGTILFN